MNTNDQILPLVSFFVLAYNQEKSVREAIESAFAQTYGNLEILLTDDASPDGTYDIMEEMASTYKGPHRLILNRNSENLGLIGHINRVMELTEGEFVIQNAGDDVSRPERTQRMIEAWEKSRRQARYIYSSVERVGEDGTRFGIWDAQPDFDGEVPLSTAIQENLFGLGAAAGWSRELFSVFGPLGDTLYVEDVALGHRALMLGPVVQIREPLVDWTIGGLSRLDAGKGPDSYFFGSRLKWIRWSVGDRKQTAKDLERVNFAEMDLCLELIERSIGASQFILRLASATFWGRLCMVPESWRRSRQSGNFDDLRTNLKYLFYLPYKAFYMIRRR